MKYKQFPAPFINQFIQPSPPIAKSKGVNFPHKHAPIPLCLCGLPPPPFDNFNPPPLPPTSPSKSYKYDSYDKTEYKVSPYC